jgi:hypothetical protein
LMVCRSSQPRAFTVVEAIEVLRSVSGGSAKRFAPERDRPSRKRKERRSARRGKPPFSGNKGIANRARWKHPGGVAESGATRSCELTRLVPEGGGGRRLVCSGCAPFAGCAEKRGLGRWVKSERNRRVGVSRLPRGPSDDEGRLGERCRQGARRRVERRALPLEGGSQRVSSSELINRCGRETVSRAEKPRVCPRVVLKSGKKPSEQCWRRRGGGESHLTSCRLAVGQGAHRETR